MDNSRCGDVGGREVYAVKTSWIIGVIMFYLLILGLEVMVTEGSLFSNAVTSNASTLLQPEITSQSNVIAQGLAILSNIGEYIQAAVEVVFLWSPSVFTGYMLWVYWFICFPTACAAIYGFVSLIRGVSTG